MKKKRKSLKQLYHIDPKQAEAEYRARFHSENVVNLPFEIGEYPAFFVVTKDIMDLMTSILRKDKEIYKLSVSLPDLKLVQKNFLLDEMITSNAIEGIHSSKKQLYHVWDKPNLGYQRFCGMTDQYRKLMDEESQPGLKACQDLQNLYDALLLEDIKEDNSENVPDGEIFRRNSVCIASGQKILHEGLMPEQKILSVLQKGLDFITFSQENPLLLAACCHFLFGFVHPFYDGMAE